MGHLIFWGILLIVWIIQQIINAAGRTAKRTVVPQQPQIPVAGPNAQTPANRWSQQSGSAAVDYGQNTQNAQQAYSYRPPSMPLQTVAPDAYQSISPPVYQQQPSAYQQQPVNQQPSAYQQQPVYQQPSAYQQQPVYQQPSAYQQQPVYQQPSAYQQQPVYQQPSAYQQQPVYQQPAPYQQQPVYQQPSAYQQQPGEFSQIGAGGPTIFGTPRISNDRQFGQRINSYLNSPDYNQPLTQPFRSPAANPLLPGYDNSPAPASPSRQQSSKAIAASKPPNDSLQSSTALSADLAIELFANRQALIRAVIFQEVLGPPLSRRHRP